VTEASSTATAEADSTDRIFKRLVHVVWAPSRGYRAVAQRPRPVPALLIVVGVTAALLVAFLSTDVGHGIKAADQIRRIQSLGRGLNPEQIADIENRGVGFRYLPAVLAAIEYPIGAMLVAGVAFAVMSLACGPAATFEQVFAIVVYSGVILLLRQLFVLSLNYVLQNLSNPATLIVFFPFIDERSLLGLWLGSFDLFAVWWIGSLALGLGVLYKQPPRRVVVSAVTVYLMATLVIAAIRA
jgi:hypothetical protein